MEPIGPPTGPVAPQAVAKVMPLGRGWMLLAVEAGFVLRNASAGLDLKLTGEDAGALRRGEITPEALAARAGQSEPPPQPSPNGSVTVAFSPEAMRISGQMSGRVSGRIGAAKAVASASKAAPQVPRLAVGWIGAGCLALLVLVLIWT